MKVRLVQPRTLSALAFFLLVAGSYWVGSATATPTCEDTCETHKCVIWKVGTQYPKLDFNYASSSTCGAVFYAEQDYHYYVISNPVFGTVRNYEGDFPDFRECDDLTTLTFWKFSGSGCATGG